MLYRIVLSKFKITKGSQGKAPYTLAQYNQAKANKEGVQKALEFAYANNYEGVLFPKGIYSFCFTSFDTDNLYNQTVLKGKSNQIINLNGAVFETIFDSDNKSPFHTKNEEPYQLTGSIFRLDYCENIEIKNGEIKGDIYNRSFKHPKETSIEQTYGIYFGRNVNNVKFDNLNVHGFMGDGFTFLTRAYDGDRLIAKEPNDALAGYLNEKGETLLINGCYTSPLIAIDLEMLQRNTPHSPKTIQIQTAGGYTRIPNFASQNLEIAFYNDNQFISKQNTKYLHKIVLPYNCNGVRLIFNAEKSGLQSLPNQGYVIMEQASHNVKLNNCKIHDSHRGGVSNPCDDITVDGCEIFHNGKDSSIGAPLFNDNTRYAINFEDTFAQTARIINNTIYSHSSGLLLSVNNVLVDNNHISDYEGNAITIYSSEKAVISNNKIYGGGALAVDQYKGKRIIKFYNNLLESKSSAFGLADAQPNDDIEISNNNITCWTLGLSGQDIKFNNNTVRLVNQILTPDVNYGIHNIVKEFKNNFLDATGSKTSFVIKANDYNGTTFKGFEKLVGRAKDTENTIKYNGVTFDNSKIWIDPVPPDSELNLILDDCKLLDSVFIFATEQIAASKIKKINITISNSHIKADVIKPFLSEDYQAFEVSGREYIFTFKNCTYEGDKDSMIWFRYMKNNVIVK